MRFRQVHLDYHTSERIPGIGSRFSKEQFQAMLRQGHVDSITVFSKCHHGWSYHPTSANRIHPNLSFDLLGALIEAAHEIDVKTPVYLSAGLDEKTAREHPEWLVRGKDERTTWASDFMQPGYHVLCMNTPYLDMLVRQIEEVVQRYDADGIFLDIASVTSCYCQFCIAAIRAQGDDPRDEQAMTALWEKTYADYARRTNEAVHKHRPDIHVFHNGGHIRRGRRDLIRCNTHHLELESLPTGGWGYDHFPLSARYAQTLGMPFLGMTGKFHTSWGEFGGYKHPNALRYEASLSLANGARISIGDQLHPEGVMDEATYALIGAAYSEVEAKEAWCGDVESIADIALLSMEAHSGSKEDHHLAKSDAGAVRMLLEGKWLFDVIDAQADIAKYRVLILPDRYTIDAEMELKLAEYAKQGGKVLASGSSGMRESDRSFVLELGARSVRDSSFCPAYFKPSFPIAGLPPASFVLYSPGKEIELHEQGVSLGERENSYFNRDIFSFCSHQHTPSSGQDAGPGMTEGAHGIYIGWEAFAEYAEKGSLALREIVHYALSRLLPDRTLTATLPAQGIVTLQSQAGERRWVNHLLYASPVRRGAGIEVIEDLIPIAQVDVTVRVSQPVTDVYLAPSLEKLPYLQADGIVRYTVPVVECHQMVVLQF
jgi:hypothetical protein